jgi:hypothetical protein
MPEIFISYWDERSRHNKTGQYSHQFNTSQRTEIYKFELNLLITRGYAVFLQILSWNDTGSSFSLGACLARHAFPHLVCQRVTPPLKLFLFAC